LSSLPDEATPAPLSPAPARRRRRVWLQPLLLLATIASLTLTGDSLYPAEGTDHGWAFVGWSYALWVLLILGAHEMGHYLACRYYGVPASLPYFLPGIPPLGSFGALIRIRGAIPDRRVLFDIAAAGPIAGFVVAVPIYVIGILNAAPLTFEPDPEAFSMALGKPLLRYIVSPLVEHEGALRLNTMMSAGWFGMFVTSLNLFPVGQLDGGHTAYAFSRRVHRTLAWTTLLAMATMIGYQAIVLRQLPGYVIWFALLCWMRDRHPPLWDESSPLGSTRRNVAVLLTLIFILSFIPVPIAMILP